MGIFNRQNKKPKQPWVPPQGHGMGSMRVGETVLPITKMWLADGNVYMEAVAVGPIKADSGIGTYYGNDGQIVSAYLDEIAEIPDVPAGTTLTLRGGIMLTTWRNRQNELEALLDSKIFIHEETEEPE